MNITPSTIEINQQTLDELRRLHKKAVDKNQPIFKYKNNQLLTAYAGYMIEHMENTLRE